MPINLFIIVLAHGILETATNFIKPAMCKFISCLELGKSWASGCLSILKINFNTRYEYAFCYKRSSSIK